jgi:hypothetical protein
LDLHTKKEIQTTINRFKFDSCENIRKICWNDNHPRLFELIIIYKNKTIKTSSFQIVARKKKSERINNNNKKSSKRIIRDDDITSNNNLLTKSRKNENDVSYDTVSDEDLNPVKKKESLPDPKIFDAMEAEVEELTPLFLKKSKSSTSDSNETKLSPPVIDLSSYEGISKFINKALEPICIGYPPLPSNFINQIIPKYSPSQSNSNEIPTKSSSDKQLTDYYLWNSMKAEDIGDLFGETISNQSNSKGIIQNPSSSSSSDKSTVVPLLHPIRSNNHLNDELKDLFGIQQIYAIEKYVEQKIEDNMENRRKLEVVQNMKFLNQMTIIKEELIKSNKDHENKMDEVMRTAKEMELNIQNKMKEIEETLKLTNENKMKEYTKKFDEIMKISTLTIGRILTLSDDCENKLNRVHTESTQKTELVINNKNEEILKSIKNHENEMKEHIKNLKEEIGIIIENKKKEIEEEIKKDYQRKLSKLFD